MKTCVLKKSATIVQSPQIIPSRASRLRNVRRLPLSSELDGRQSEFPGLGSEVPGLWSEIAGVDVIHFRCLFELTWAREVTM